MQVKPMDARGAGFVDALHHRPRAHRHVVCIETVHQHGSEQAGCTSAALSQMRNVREIGAGNCQHGTAAISPGRIPERDDPRVLILETCAPFSARAWEGDARGVVRLLAEASLSTMGWPMVHRTRARPISGSARCLRRRLLGSVVAHILGQDDSIGPGDPSLLPVRRRKAEGEQVGLQDVSNHGGIGECRGTRALRRTHLELQRIHGATTCAFGRGALVVRGQLQLAAVRLPVAAGTRQQCHNEHEGAAC
mmetsp:Transcript_31882/g.80833  ORF Transcript_31882/g.80833 Transcript_31882/m.80833 type:complete len:250 (+) Transcript_31882:315-1064(+)